MAFVIIDDPNGGTTTTVRCGSNNMARIFSPNKSV